MQPTALIGREDEVAAICGLLGRRRAPTSRARYAQKLATARAQLGDEGFAAAWAAGGALTLEQAIAAALGEG